MTLQMLPVDVAPVATNRGTKHKVWAFSRQRRHRIRLARIRLAKMEAYLETEPYISTECEDVRLRIQQKKRQSDRYFESLQVSIGFEPVKPVVTPKTDGPKISWDRLPSAAYTFYGDRPVKRMSRDFLKYARKSYPVLLKTREQMTQSALAGFAAATSS